jgi:hypothetical protein
MITDARRQQNTEVLRQVAHERHNQTVRLLEAAKNSDHDDASLEEAVLASMKGDEALIAVLTARTEPAKPATPPEAPDAA